MPRVLFLAALCTSLAMHAQDPKRRIEFSDIDQKLLIEANQLDEQFEKKGLVDHDVRAEDYLAEIGKRLLDGQPVPDHVTYRFRILRDPMVNAFALPNGSIYVNTGIVAAVENESQLASILAHEITHVDRYHAYIMNRSIRKKAVAIDIIAVGGGLGGYVPGLYGASAALASQASQLFIVATVFGYSRELEGEADTDGYKRLVRAGYDGTAFADTLKKLDEKIEFEPTQPFWRTHPKIQERIATAEKLAQNNKAANPNKKTTGSEYLEQVAPVIRYNISLDLDGRRARTARARAERLVKWEPANAVNQTLLADAYRSLGAKTVEPTVDELSDEGKKLARKNALKLTEAEEQKALLASDAGKQTLASNQALSEKLYKEAISADAHLPEPHRGLGMLYQAEGKNAEAAREYRAYLDLTPEQATDRLRIERRLALVAEKKQ